MPPPAAAAELLYFKSKDALERQAARGKWGFPLPPPPPGRGVGGGGGDSRKSGSVLRLASGLDSKESTCNAGHPGSILGSGRSPGEGNCNPL